MTINAEISPVCDAIHSGFIRVREELFSDNKWNSKEFELYRVDRIDNDYNVLKASLLNIIDNNVEKIVNCGFKMIVPNDIRPTEWRDKRYGYFAQWTIVLIKNE